MVKMFCNGTRAETPNPVREPDKSQNTFKEL